jgi:hypothetical protein
MSITVPSQPVVLHVADIIEDTRCIATDDGEKVFLKVREHLRNGDDVELSFEGVTLVISAFLNVAIGRLYGEFSAEEIKKRFKVRMSRSEDIHKLERTMKHGEEFYKDPEFNTHVFAESYDEIC